MRRPVPVATLSAAAADRPRASPSSGSSSHRSTPTVLPTSGQRPPGRRRRARRIPALPRHPDLGRRRGRRPGRGGAGRGAGCAKCHGVAGSTRRSGCGARRHGDRGDLRDSPSSPTAQPGDRRADPRPAGRRRGRRSWSAAPPPTSSTSSRASPSHLPLALAIVVVATLVVLFLMTGSVVLPVKSLLMNVLNLSAVFGLLVLIFQDGRLEGLLGYTSHGGDRADDADPALRGRLRPLDRLRRLPALADQGGARQRRLGLRVRRDRASSGPGGSSPPRRCCSRSRSAPSPPRRSSSSRRTASARRSRC